MGFQPQKAVGGWLPSSRLLSNPWFLVPGWGLIGRFLGWQLVNWIRGSGWQHLLFYVLGGKQKNKMTNMKP